MLLLHGTCTVLIQEICLHRIGKAERNFACGAFSHVFIRTLEALLGLYISSSIQRIK